MSRLLIRERENRICRAAYFERTCLLQVFAFEKSFAPESSSSDADVITGVRCIRAEIRRCAARIASMSGAMSWDCVATVRLECIMAHLKQRSTRPGGHREPCTLIFAGANIKILD